MVVISKLFQTPLCQLNCAGFLHHRNHTCTEAFLWSLVRNHISGAKYYLPLLLLPLLMSFRKLNRSRIRDIVENYVKTTSYAGTINALIFYMICVFRRINGRFVRWCTPPLAAYVAAQVIWLVPSKILLFLNTGVTASAFETLLRQLDLGVVHSRATQTLIFMICSLAVLRAQQLKLYKGFWFIRPAQLPENYAKWTLEERIKAALYELRNYLSIGVALDIFNALLSQKLKHFQLRSTTFMLSYIGVYKLVQCLLADKMDEKPLNLMAAFVSGISFRFVGHIPLTFMSFAVIIACQVLWQQFFNRDIPLNNTMATLQRVPWARLVWPISLSFLVDRFFIHQDVLNGLTKAFINGTSDNKAKRMHDLMTLPEETIISKFQHLPCRPFFF